MTERSEAPRAGGRVGAAVAGGPWPSARRTRDRAGGRGRGRASRLAAAGPVRVRVPAKINLHLGVGPLRADGYHELNTVYHAICLYDELTARPGDTLTLTMEGEGAGELAARRVQPGDPGGPGAGRARRRARRTPGCTCASRSRSPAGWPAAAPTRPPRWWPATRCGAPACPATSWPSIAADARLRRAVPGARRHRAGHRPGRGGQPGAGPATPGTGWSRSPTAACPPRRSTASSTGCGPAGIGRRRRPASADDAARRAAPARPGGARRRARQRPAGGGARRCGPALARHAARPATTPARSPASSPAPGPTCVFLAADAPARRRDRRRPRARPGVCRAGAPGAPGRSPGARVRLMANIINLDRVSKGYGAAGRCSIDVSLGLDDADRVGVVGLNGAGKTTLLRLLAKAEEPDAGRVTHRRDLRVAALPQTLDLPPDGHRARRRARHRLAAGRASPPSTSGPATPASAPSSTVWACADLGLDAPVGPMSGGERRRVALAALLVRASDLLDPRRADQPPRRRRRATGWPTTCCGRRGALVVVTHDRWFLDAVCTSTWEVGRRAPCARTRAATPPGCWPAPSASGSRPPPRRAGRTCCARRSPGCAAGRRPAPPSRKFRIDAANALIADVPPPRDTVSLRRLATARLGKQVYELRDVTVRAGDKPILSTVDLAGRARATGSALARRERRRQVDAAAAARRVACRRRRPGAASARRCGRRSCPRSWPSCPADAAGAGGRRGGGPAGRARRPGAVGRRSWPRSSASPTVGCGRRSATCPAASGAGCRCCGCSPASRTCCCSTSPPTTSTPTRWPRWRTCSTPGPARWSWPATTGTWSSGSATRCTACSATAGCATCPAGSTSTWPRRLSRARPAARSRPGVEGAERPSAGRLQGG